MNASDHRPRRVAITGLGIISPVGNDPDSFWNALVEGRSGVSALDDLPPESYPVRFAGYVRDFQGKVGDFGQLDPKVKKAIQKGLKLMCQETQMGVAAAQKALTDASWELGTCEPERIGVSFGTGHMFTMPEDLSSGMRSCVGEAGEFVFDRWGEEAMRQITPLWLLRYLPNMPACHIAIYNDMRGPNNSITQGETAANMAIAEAAHVIARGAADLMVAGATGTRLHPLRTIHAVLQEQVARDDNTPESASRPFDRDRRGMVVGEGASALVLEEYESAVARGATIYGEIIGAGSSCVAARNHVGGRRQALTNAMRAALRQSGLEPSQVGHIHAHGLSTRTSDADESQALLSIFDGSSRPIPVVAAKSHFGNLGAGSGAVELAASLLAMKHERLFPVLNYQTPDPECPVVVDADAAAGDVCMNLSVVAQGQASCLLVRRAG